MLGDLGLGLLAAGSPAAAAGVAHQLGEVADDQDHGVPEALELGQLAGRTTACPRVRWAEDGTMPSLTRRGRLLGGGFGQAGQAVAGWSRRPPTGAPAAAPARAPGAWARRSGLTKRSTGEGDASTGGDEAGHRGCRRPPPSCAAHHATRGPGARVARAMVLAQTPAGGTARPPGAPAELTVAVDASGAGGSAGVTLVPEVLGQPGGHRPAAAGPVPHRQPGAAVNPPGCPPSHHHHDRLTDAGGTRPGSPSPTPTMGQDDSTLRRDLLRRRCRAPNAPAGRRSG